MATRKLTPEDIVFQLDDDILEAIDKFNDGIPKDQERMFDNIIELVSDLERKNGNLVLSTKNLKIVRKIREQLGNAIVNKEYLKRVKEFTDSFEQIEKTNDLYFASIVTNYAKNEVFKEIRSLAIEQTVLSLTQVGLNANIGIPVADMLNTNVTSGGSYKSLLEQLRQSLLNNGESKGYLDRYAKTIATDSLNQFSRNYSQLVTEDLGLVWFYYAGDKMETSRDFCIEMMKARNGGCRKFWHKSEIPELLKGNICDKQVPIYDKTGLPYGFLPNTTPTNFPVLLGGYNCGHRFTSVPSSVVPKKLRDQFGS
jgi:hypothetical protein